MENLRRVCKAGNLIYLKSWNDWMIVNDMFVITCKYGYLDIVKYLLTYAEEHNQIIKTKTISNALEISSKRGHIGIITYVLQYLKEDESDGLFSSSTKKKWLETALEAAYVRAKILKWLSSQTYLDVNICTYDNPWKEIDPHCSFDIYKTVKAKIIKHDTDRIDVIYDYNDRTFKEPLYINMKKRMLKNYKIFSNLSPEIYIDDEKTAQ